jgi:thiamine transport system permease protein
MRVRGAALLVPPLLMLAAFFAFPLARTLTITGGAAWGWLGASPYVQQRVTVAFVQAAASVALTMGIAAPLAWFYHRRALPFERWQLALHAAPFVLPVFVVVFGIQAVLGSRGWLASLTGFDALGALGPLGAVVVAHAYYNYGLAARLLHGTLARRPRRLEEAAHVLGSSPWQASARVTLPLLAPSVAAVMLLTFFFAFTSFGVVLFLGEGQVATLETLLFENIGGAFPSYDRAAALGILQLVINLVVLGAYMRLRRTETTLPSEAPRAAAPAHARARVLSWGLVALALLPLLAVLTGGFRLGGDWSLEPWRALLDPAHPGHKGSFSITGAVGWSVLYAGLATVGSLVLTVLLAYGLRALGGPWRRVAEGAAALPLGTSPLLLGFGFLVAFGAGAWLDLRATPAAVVLAHTLIAFPFTARVLLPKLQQLDRRLDEAAALLGASPGSVVARIHAPLLRGPLTAAAGFAMALSLGDFGASLVLMRPDAMGLSMWVLRLGGPSSFDPLARAQSLALAGMLLLLTVGAYVAMERFRAPGEVF